MVRITNTRTTILAALAAAFCALSLSPAALAARDKGRVNAGGAHQAKPAARQADSKQGRGKSEQQRRAGSEQRQATPDGHQPAPKGRDADFEHRFEGRDGRRDGGGDGGREGRRSEPGPRHAEPVCCTPSGAGILRVGACSIQIGDNHKYKKIANAFKDAGYQAYVRNHCGVVSVRVYGFPSFDWTPGKFDTHTSRQGSVLQIELCKIGR